MYVKRLIKLNTHSQKTLKIKQALRKNTGLDNTITTSAKSESQCNANKIKIQCTVKTEADSSVARIHINCLVIATKLNKP